MRIPGNDGGGVFLSGDEILRRGACAAGTAAIVGRQLFADFVPSTLESVRVLARDARSRNDRSGEVEARAGSNRTRGAQGRLKAGHRPTERWPDEAMRCRPARSARPLDAELGWKPQDVYGGGIPFDTRCDDGAKTVVNDGTALAGR